MFQSAPGGGAGGNDSPSRSIANTSGFNPPPAVGPGETTTRSSRWSDNPRFQSAPGGGAGGNWRLPVLHDRRICFNPPPAVGPGETWDRRGRRRQWRVSIRPRRWGRGKRCLGSALPSRLPFQSAPGGGAGGNAPLRSPRQATDRFNPPPAVGPGETGFDAIIMGREFRFNPPPAVGPGETKPVKHPSGSGEVSIRPRRWGRGKPGCLRPRRPSRRGFQSAPGGGAGGNDDRRDAGGVAGEVSIRPRRWGRGKLTDLIQHLRPVDVSIRPRRWGRGKPARQKAVNEQFEFQSAPGGGAGGNGYPCSEGTVRALFQSAPGGGAGGNSECPASSASNGAFQSAPGGGAGGNWRRWWWRGQRWTFQSAPGGGAGGNQVRAHAEEILDAFQSAPGGGAGGNRRGGRDAR